MIICVAISLSTQSFECDSDSQWTECRLISPRFIVSTAEPVRALKECRGMHDAGHPRINWSVAGPLWRGWEEVRKAVFSCASERVAGESRNPNHSSPSHR
jgi:hypothetical protein